MVPRRHPVRSHATRAARKMTPARTTTLKWPLLPIDCVFCSTGSTAPSATRDEKNREEAQREQSACVFASTDLRACETSTAH